MSGPNGESGAPRSRTTKRFSVFDCDAHINDPDEIWSRLRRARVPRARPPELLEGRAPGDPERTHAGHRRRGLRLPRLQPDLSRRPADDEEDRAEAPADRPHAGAEEVRRASGRVRPEGASPRDGPHGDRPGHDHPDDAGRELPVHRERRGRLRARARLQRLGARLLRGGAGPALPRSLPPAPEPALHVRGARARRRLRLPRGAHPSHRRARQVSELHPPRPHRRRAHEHHGQGVPEVRGDGDRPRHAHLPGEQSRDRHEPPPGGANRPRDLARRPDRARRRDARRRPYGRRADA